MTLNLFKLRKALELRAILHASEGSDLSHVLWTSTRANARTMYSQEMYQCKIQVFIDTKRDLSQSSK